MTNDCSEWREWDLHIHSPASFHWDGERFGKDKSANAKLIDGMIGALNQASPAAFAIMDYWHFDGWCALKSRLAEENAPSLKKKVFPGIELRLSAPMETRLNAHVIFSDEIKDQYLRDFLSVLRLELTDHPLSPNALIEYARSVNEDKLKAHGLDKAAIKASDEIALQAGSMIAEIKVETYKEAVRAVPNGQAIGFMPFSTNDGLEQIKWAEHYAYSLGLFEASPIFETRKYDQWAAFVGLKTPGNEKWFDAFQEAMKGTPRLAVSGSDAHRFKGVAGDANKRGYGDFPSGKTTWIKADPTWCGLLQALKEPENRSYLGACPPKLETVQQNKTFYIDRLSATKVPGSTLTDVWLDGCDIKLNPDLIAIIGNKGSGKSALADMIALLGHSQQKAYFSFLKKDRFRGKSGEPARQFRACLKWLAGEPSEMLLSDDPAADKVELVKYIPQGRFEALCNDHVSGRSNAFEQELREVIFTHIDASDRADAFNFEELIEQQEVVYRVRLSELRKSMHLLNEKIVSTEEQLHPDVKKHLTELLKLKTTQLEEHQAGKPKEIAPLAEQLTPMQSAASARSGTIDLELVQIDLQIKALAVEKQSVAKKQRAYRNLTERIALLQTQFEQFRIATDEDATLLGLNLFDVAALSISLSGLTECKTQIDTEDKKQIGLQKNSEARREVLVAEKAGLLAVLNEPQKVYQKYLSDLVSWSEALEKIEGLDTEPESKRGLERRLAQLSELPKLVVDKKVERDEVCSGIFNVLSELRDTRAKLFSPLQRVIDENALIREEYRLKFQSHLQGLPEDIATNLFDMIRRSAGELRGEDESIQAVRTRFEKYHFANAAEAVSFSGDLEELLRSNVAKSHVEIPGIAGLLRKGKKAVEVYDYIYSLTYLEPKYTLLFQDTEIERLSPGQRGALLLIFYLLVDKGRNPIVLDQPEENLDNETVVSLLVPVIKEAKKSRQIIMVTHNPNLAVVCDAEQIIHAEFDRKNGCQMIYRSGSIEDEIANKTVVDVLEGTKKAFTNRGQKYH